MKSAGGLSGIAFNLYLTGFKFSMPSLSEHKIETIKSLSTSKEPLIILLLIIWSLFLVSFIWSHAHSIFLFTVANIFTLLPFMILTTDVFPFCLDICFPVYLGGNISKPIFVIWGLLITKIVSGFVLILFHKEKNELFSFFAYQIISESILVNI